MDLDWVKGMRTLVQKGRMADDEYGEKLIELPSLAVLNDGSLLTSVCPPLSAAMPPAVWWCPVSEPARTEPPDSH